MKLVRFLSGWPLDISMGYLSVIDIVTIDLQYVKRLTSCRLDVVTCRS